MLHQDLAGSAMPGACSSRHAWRLFPVTIGMLLGLSAASMCPEPVIPCERRSFFTNISAQVDIEAPKQGAVIGKDSRVKLGLALSEEERPRFEAMMDRVVVCVRLDRDEHIECRALSESASLRLAGLAPGPHCLSAWVQDLYGRRVGYAVDSTTEFSVIDLAQVMREKMVIQAQGDGGWPMHALEIVTPDNHTTALAHSNVLVVSVEGSLRCSPLRPCLSSWPRTLLFHLLDARSLPLPPHEATVYHAFDSPVILSPPPSNSSAIIVETRLRASVHVPLDALPFLTGFFVLRVSMLHPHLHRAHTHTASQASVLVVRGLSSPFPHIHSAPLLLFRHAIPSPPPPSPSPSPPLVIVTAANEPYLSRLTNLIGSLHFWSPHTHMLVYDLGLTTFSRQQVSSYVNVEVRDLPWASLPPHFRDVRLCAFKALVVLHALQDHARVLWLDANFELRRPLDEISRLMGQRNGSFLTVSGHLFPTDKVVRPSTLHSLGCDVPFASRVEATSAVMGVHRDSILGRHILPAMHRCALDEKGCHFPPDATFANQRRDQSALNAALCGWDRRQAQQAGGEAWESVVVDPDKRFWMWADQSTYPPPPQPEMFSDMVLYSRRGRPPLGYSRYVQGREGGGEGEEAWAMLLPRAVGAGIVAV